MCSVFESPDRVLAGRGRRFDPIGGMQNHTAKLTAALDRRGLRQTVVTTRPPGAPVRERIGRDGTILRLGLPVRTARQFYCVPAAILAPGLGRSADLVHVHLGEDLAIVPLALEAAVWGAPIVLTVHNSPRHTLCALDRRTRLLRRLGEPLERLGTRRAARVIVLTERLRECLIADGVPPERIAVVPSGVDPSEFAGEPPDPFPAVARPRVVYAGRLARAKGVDTLVAAAARMKTQAPVVLVGDGPERAGLERAVSELGLGDRVTFTGFLPHRAIPAVLAHADVLVLPSRYEELGSVLVEGLAAGVPIVASRTGGIPEAVGDAGILVSPEAPDELAAALDVVLCEPALARVLSRRARERAPSFHWEGLADRVLASYAGALSDRG
jgi:glycosyltransferase involved in cell wall biosynthesis